MATRTGAREKCDRCGNLTFAEIGENGKRHCEECRIVLADRLAAAEEFAANAKTEADTVIAFPNSKTPKRPLCTTDTETVELMLDATIGILVDQSVTTKGWDRTRTVAAATGVLTVTMDELEERDFTNAAQAMGTDESDKDVVLVAGYWRHARRAQTFSRLHGPADELTTTAQKLARAYHADCIEHGIDPDELV